MASQSHTQVEQELLQAFVQLILGLCRQFRLIFRVCVRKKAFFFLSPPLLSAYASVHVYITDMAIVVRAVSIKLWHHTYTLASHTYILASHTYTLASHTKTRAYKCVLTEPAVCKRRPITYTVFLCVRTCVFARSLVLSGPGNAHARKGMIIGLEICHIRTEISVV